MSSNNTYQVNTKIPGYYTSLDAMNHHDRRCYVYPGTYYIFNQANGAINVTTKKGEPGSWINPNDNTSTDLTEKSPETSNQSTSQGSNSSQVSTSNDVVKTVSETGTNKKVYSPNKDHIPCYIINTTIGNGIMVEFECEPDEISDNNSAKFDNQDIRGRSAPYVGYDSSGPRNVNFSVTLHDDLCKNGILTTVNRLKSLNYPEYGNGVLAPPKALIHIGKMINGYFAINSVNVTWKKPYRSEVYVQAEVSIDATEVPQTAYSASDIWSKGGYI